MTIKKHLLAGCEKIGIDQPLVRAYDTVAGLTPEISSAIRSFDGPTPKGAVLLPLVPGYRNICVRACVVADALRRRGYEPVLFYDDTTDVPFGTQADETVATTAENRYYRRRVPNLFGLDSVGFSDILPAGYDYSKGLTGDEREAELRRFARGSTRRHHKIYTLDQDDAKIDATYRRFCNGARVVADVTRRLIDNRDTIAVMTHEPYYVHGGVPLSVAAAADVHAVSVMTGYRPWTLLFGRVSNRSSLPMYTADSVVENALSRPLTDAEADEIEQLMDDWESGEERAHAYTPDTNVSVSSDRQLVGLFTNLLWDASLEPESAVYTDVFEWIADTVDVLGGRDDLDLVIKTHPAESKFGTNESVAGWFETAYDDLPLNVTLLPPDTDVDTYALLDSLDVCLVYNSTVGLEAAFRGLPVVVVGQTHYREHGLTVDPESPASYVRTVADAAELECTPGMRRRAKRYAHLLLFKRHLDFPYDRECIPRSDEFVPLRPAHTGPGVPTFDALIDALINGREMMAPKYEAFTCDIA